MAASNTIILSSSSPASWIVTTPPGKAGMEMSSSPLPSPSVLIRGATAGLAKARKERNRGIDDEIDSAFARARGCGVGGSGFDPTPLPPKKTLGSGLDAIDRVGKLREVAKKDGMQNLDVNDVVVPTTKTRAPRKAKTATGNKKASTTSIEKNLDGAKGAPPIKVRKPRAPNKTAALALEEHDKASIPEVEVVDGVIVFKQPRPSCEKVVTGDKGPANLTSGDYGLNGTVGPGIVKKPRPRKSSEEGQTRIKKGKIVKPRTFEAQGDALISKRTPATKMSAEAPSLDILAERDMKSSVRTDEPLGLDLAIPRRKSWTPVKDCNFSIEQGKEPGNGDRSRTLIDAYSIDLTIDTPQPNVLGSHLNNYGFNGVVPTGIPVQCADGIPLSKRRKLDMIETTIPQSKKDTAKRNQSPRRKPQTITEKATAPFLHEKRSKEPSLLNYFSQSALDGDPDSANLNDTQVELQAKSAAPTARKRKGSNPKSRKPAATLLPPEQALEATKDQNILFGTSSQLVTETSPTVIREIQQAVRASETFEILSDSGVLRITDPGSPTPSKLTRGISSRNLWSEAARDSQGSLLESGVINLIDTPKVSEALKQISAADPFSGIDVVATSLMQDSGWLPIDSLGVDAPQIYQGLVPVGPAPNEAIAVPTDEIHVLPRCPAEAALRPRSKSPIKKKKGSEEQTAASVAMPRYEGMTVTELAKAISGYGFKAIKNRDAMIALLKKCWEQKQQRTLQSLPNNVVAPTLPQPSGAIDKNINEVPSPAKKKGRPSKTKNTVDEKSAPNVSKPKPRGRPKRTVAASATTDLTDQLAITDPPVTPVKSKSKKPSKTRRSLPDEIEDPDPPPTPSPPRRSKTLLSPRALQLLPATSTSSNLEANTAPIDKSILFVKITQTITMTPATNDPKNLSWHEKILLYDPIVIEDLTAWLNTEGLGRVGVDEEVGVDVVKEWCEGRSICCLWRDGWRGRRGKGKGSDD